MWVVAAVTFVDVNAAGLDPGQRLQLGDDRPQSVAIKQIAVQGLGVQHKLAAFGFGDRGRHRDLATKLVGRPCLALADAFDLGGVQRIDLGAALPVILQTHPHRQGEQVGKALLEQLVAGDLAADVADHTAEANAQKLQLPPGPFELVRMGVAPDHNRSALGNAPVALPQWQVMAPREIDQFFQCAMAQPRIGRVRDRFGLHRGVDHDPFEITGRQRAGLVRHRQALLDQRHQLFFAQAPHAHRLPRVGAPP